MPNWCSNSLTTDNPVVVSVMKELSECEGRIPLFDRFVPMPMELRGIYTGSTMIDGKKFELWRSDETGHNTAVSAEEINELIAKHGATNWYDWSVKHWGTKWESSDVSIDFVGESAVVHFDTAWGPPVAWLERLVDIHPAGTYELAYSEGGMGIRGLIVIENGDVVENENIDGSFWIESSNDEEEESDDPYDSLTPSTREFLEKYGLGIGG